MASTNKRVKSSTPRVRFKEPEKEEGNRAYEEAYAGGSINTTACDLVSCDSGSNHSDETVDAPASPGSFLDNLDPRLFDYQQEGPRPVSDTGFRALNSSVQAGFNGHPVDHSYANLPGPAVNPGFFNAPLPAHPGNLPAFARFAPEAEERLPGFPYTATYPPGNHSTFDRFGAEAEEPLPGFAHTATYPPGDLPTFDRFAAEAEELLPGFAHAATPPVGSDLNSTDGSTGTVPEPIRNDRQRHPFFAEAPFDHSTGRLVASQQPGCFVHPVGPRGATYIFVPYQNHLNAPAEPFRAEALATAPFLEEEEEEEEEDDLAADDEPAFISPFLALAEGAEDIGFADHQQWSPEHELERTEASNLSQTKNVSTSKAALLS